MVKKFNNSFVHERLHSKVLKLELQCLHSTAVQKKKIGLELKVLDPCKGSACYTVDRNRKHYATYVLNLIDPPAVKVKTSAEM